jgi:hypothetical protein
MYDTDLNIIYISKGCIRSIKELANDEVFVCVE